MKSSLLSLSLPFSPAFRLGIPLAIAVAAADARALGPQPSDQIDVFYQVAIQPQIELLIDKSSSMNGNAGVQVCPWYQTSGPLAPVSASQMRKKHHQVRASLIGCNSTTDGILDKWAGKVNFAIRLFSSGTNLLTPFWTSAPVMESAIAGFGLSGGTSMTLGLQAAGSDFLVFNDLNSKSCRPNIIILLSDGNPNSSGATFAQECDLPGPPDIKTYGAGEPWCGAGYLAGTLAPASGGPINCTPALTTPYTDQICLLTGAQDIKTYTIGFGTSGSFSPSNLQRIATLGEGQYYYASNVSMLDTALNSIINAFSNRAMVVYAPPAVTLDGVFSGTDAFSASFKPTANGFWAGNLKKSCMMPDLLTNGDFDTTSTCYYVRDPADFKKVIANAASFDQWSSTTVQDTTVGGAGQVLRNLLATTPSGPTPRLPLYPRTLLTWKPGTPSLIAVSAANLGPDDLWIHSTERAKTINRVHGYTYDVDLTDGGSNDDDVSGLDPDDTNPVAVDTWPLADTLNAEPKILEYQGGAKYVLLPANDGMIHAFDANSGAETSALLVGEALKPNSMMNFSLRDAMVSASSTVRHPYLLDGAQRLYHEDLDADLKIDSGERAALIVGTGRAGAGYYLIDMQSFNGTFSTAANPVYPLFRTPGTHYEDLADTWAAPWVGKMKVAGTVYPVAIFGSGHERGWDDASSLIPAPLPGEYQISSATPELCMTLTVTSSLAAGYCNFMFPFVGYPDPVPLDLTIGPVQLPNAVAYRVQFGTFNIDPNDEIRVQSGEGHTAEVLRGLKPTSYWTQWVYDDQLAMEMITDGNQTTHPGFTILGIEYITAAPGTPRQRAPSLYVVDLNRWNGPATGPGAAQRFAATTSDGGMLLRFTSDCKGQNVGTTCYDPSAGPAFADLQYMRCSISGEMAVLETGGRIERGYIGDDCGQIWRLMTNTLGQWRVDRVFNANEDTSLNPALAPGGSCPTSNNCTTRIRKIQRRIDLVRSRCSGKNAIGLYFGTGDAQRPTAMGELPGRNDIAGVLWDDGTIGNTTGVGDLADVSTTDSISAPTISAGGQKGWYFRLRNDERMLRDPVVFARTAYYKTFRPTTTATECSPGAGEDAIYSVDSCSAEAYNDANGNGVKTYSERLAQVSMGDIGGSPSLVATRDTVVVLGGQGQLNVRPVSDYRRARMLNWRLTK